MATTTLRIEPAWSWKRLWFVLPGVIGPYMVIAPWLGPPWFVDDVAAGTMSTILGLIAIAVGWGLGLHRSGWDFDKGSVHYRSWWGVGVPWSAGRRTLEPGSRVGVKQDLRRVSDHRELRYVLQLLGPKGATTLKSWRAYRPARMAGEHLARFLQQPMEDTATHERILRQPDELDLSVRERAQRSLEPTPMPPIPHELGLEHEIGPDAAEVRVPGMGWLSPRGFRVGACLGIALVAIYICILDWAPDVAALASSEDEVEAFIGRHGPTVLWLPVVLPLLWALPALAGMFTSDRIHVTRDGLRVVRVAPWRRRGWEMDAADIEHIAVVPRERDYRRNPSQRERVVSVQSDGGFLELAPARNEVEQDWLRDLLLHYLAG